MCEESTLFYLGLHLSALHSQCTRDSTTSDPSFKLLKFVQKQSPRITQERAVCCFYVSQSKITHSLQRITSFFCNQWSEHRKDKTGATKKTAKEYLQADHSGCYSSTVFGSSRCRCRSWSSPTDPLLKAFSHHPSQSDTALSPTVPSEACHSNLWGGYRVTAALHHTLTQTHPPAHNNTEKI